MPRIVAMIQVENLATWEENFRTHEGLFRRQTINGYYDYTMIEEENRVVLSADVADIDTFFKVLETQDAADAIELDGVHRDSIQFFVLDKRYEF